MERETLSISSNGDRVGSLYQNTEAHDKLLAQNGNDANYCFGRPHFSQIKSLGIDERLDNDSMGIRERRVPHKLGEIRNRSQLQDRISRLPYRFVKNANSLTRLKYDEGHSGMSRCNATEIHNCSSTCKSNLKN